MTRLVAVAAALNPLLGAVARHVALLSAVVAAARAGTSALRAVFGEVAHCEARSASCQADSQRLTLVAPAALDVARRPWLGAVLGDVAGSTAVVASAWAAAAAAAASFRGVGGGVPGASVVVGARSGFGGGGLGLGLILGLLGLVALGSRVRGPVLGRHDAVARLAQRLVALALADGRVGVGQAEVGHVVGLQRVVWILCGVQRRGWKREGELEVDVEASRRKR